MNLNLVIFLVRTSHSYRTTLLTPNDGVDTCNSRFPSYMFALLTEVVFRDLDHLVNKLTHNVQICQGGMVNSEVYLQLQGCSCMC